MNTTYFKAVDTLDELKKQFRQLAKDYHPDAGGSDKKMTQIIDEYKALKEKLEKQGKGTRNEKRTAAQDWEMDECFRNIIMKIAHLPIEIEICGEWIWVGGETFSYVDILGKNGLGFQWSKPKKKWYWAPYKLGKKRRTNTPMGKIRQKYGSTTVDRDERKALR